jgi:hypothetical protein
MRREKERKRNRERERKRKRKREKERTFVNWVREKKKHNLPYRIRSSNFNNWVMMRLFPAPVSPTKLTLIELRCLSARAIISLKFVSFKSTVIGDSVVVHINSHCIRWQKNNAQSINFKWDNVCEFHVEK